MSRGNLILLGALVVAVGLWLAGRDWARDKTTAPAPRLFPEFNREGADRIEISGGAAGTTWAIARPEGAPWSLVSAGGYPVKRAEVDRFLDAVASLRKDNPVGTSEQMRAQTHTDEKYGRLVRVLKAGQPLAEFLVGKSPKRGYSEFFIRRQGDDAIYRTTTFLGRERDAVTDPLAPGASGFDWHAYTHQQSRKWVDTAIWDLGGAEVQELRLTRRDRYDATLVKQAQDKWELKEEGKEPVPADADAADGILSVVRRLSLEEVLGPYAEVRKEYGLESPDVTLLMKLRKKAPAPAKEGEGEEPKEEYATFHRTVEIGKKVPRPRFDGYADEMKSDDFYAIRVGPESDIEDGEEKKRAGYVFLVREYTATQLMKELSDLQAKPEEEKGPGDEEEATGTEPGDEEPGDDEGKPADEEEKAPGEEKPEDEEKPEGDGCGDGSG